MYDIFVISTKHLYQKTVGDSHMKNVSQEAYQRQRMIKYSEKHSVTETAIRYRTSRKTVYKWKKDMTERFRV